MLSGEVRKRRPTVCPVVLARRKPRFELRLPGSFLLRLAERQLVALLFQLPPRLTRFEPHRPSPEAPGSFKHLPADSKRIRASKVCDHRLHACGKIAILELPRRPGALERTNPSPHSR